jgi:deoxyribonuclease V
MENLPDMLRETYDLVAQVPKGRVTTYGAVARALGDVVASRYVGLAMSMNNDIVRVPCRRVVQSDGFVGGYTGGGPEKKIRLLKAEGVDVAGGRIVDLESVLFKDFESTYPLKGLRDRQASLKRKLVTKALKGPVERVAGIDVAYSGDKAFSAMAVVDYATGDVVDDHLSEGRATFPYIPTYLAFRELPLIAPLMRYVDARTVVMYDGNGMLHPHGFGIASQLGVTFDVPTIGIAKKLLCGDVSGRAAGGRRAVRMNGRTIGFALSARRSGNPVYVSIGNKISLAQAVEVSARLLKFRVPEPTRQAHILAERARRSTNNK